MDFSLWMQKSEILPLGILHSAKRSLTNHSQKWNWFGWGYDIINTFSNHSLPVTLTFLLTVTRSLAPPFYFLLYGIYVLISYHCWKGLASCSSRYLRFFSRLTFLIFVIVCTVYWNSFQQVRPIIHYIYIFSTSKLQFTLKTKGCMHGLYLLHNLISITL